MDAQSQPGQMRAILAWDPGAHCIQLITIRFEHNRATFSKPAARLRRRLKPRASILDFLQQATIRGVPQSLRSYATVVPVNGESTPKLGNIVDHSVDECCRLSRG